MIGTILQARLPWLVSLYLVFVLLGEAATLTHIAGLPIRLSQFCMLAIIGIRLPFIFATIPRPLFAMLGLLLGYSMLSSLTYYAAGHPEQARQAYYHVGLLSGYLLFALAVGSHPWKLSEVTRVGRPVAVMLILVSAATILDAQGWGDIPVINNASDRTGATFFTNFLYIHQHFGPFDKRTALAASMAIFVPFLWSLALYRFKKHQPSLLFWCGGVAGMWMLLASHNRAALIAIAGSVLIGIFLLGKGRTTKALLAYAASVAVIIIGLQLLLPGAAVTYRYFLTGDTKPVVTYILQRNQRYESPAWEEERFAALSREAGRYKQHDLEQSDNIRLKWFIASWKTVLEYPWGVGPAKILYRGDWVTPHSVPGWLLLVMGLLAIPWICVTSTLYGKHFITHYKAGREARDLIIICTIPILAWGAMSLMHEIIYFGTFWLFLGWFSASKQEKQA